MKFTVGMKIGIGFGLMLFALAMLGSIAIYNIDRFIKVSAAESHSLIVLDKINELSSTLKDAETGQRGYILTGKDSYLEPYNLALQLLPRNIEDLRKLTDENPQMKSKLDTMELLIKDKLKELNESIELRKNKGLQPAINFVASDLGKKTMDSFRQVSNEVGAEERKSLNEITRVSEKSAATTVSVIGYGMLLISLLIASIAVAIIRNIVNPLKEVAKKIEKIARGELNAKVDSNLNRQDEIGGLLINFNHMTQYLQGVANIAKQIAAGDLRVTLAPQSEEDVLTQSLSMMVDGLRHISVDLVTAVDVLNSSAVEISAASSQLAHSAVETSAAVNETTTTMEEVRQTAEVTSQKAASISEDAKKVDSISQAGSKAIQDTGDGMGKIRTQMDLISESMLHLSEKNLSVGEIISTVDDLAQQSNLLAVNATIEAAKAGEHGQGFSVVAQEIKNLADQSRQATNQVRSLLDEIQKASSAAVMATEQGTKTVDVGVNLSEEAGQSIYSLTTNIADTVQSVTQIAVSSRQQLAGIGQVAQAMENINDVVNQNVTSTKQLESSAQNIDKLSSNLKDLISNFKT